MDLGLTGKVALVTGASKGIGAAIAAELEAEGARVAAQLAQHGALRLGHERRRRRRRRSSTRSRRELGPIDILVCNTGGPPLGEPLSFTREQWEAAYRSLVLAPVALIERVLPGMRERAWGRVLNVASSSVREPIA